MTTTATPRPGPRRLLASLASFVLLCGVVLVLVTGPGAAPPEASGGPTSGDRTLDDRLRGAMREARSAERALIDANYGEVHQHIRRLIDRSLPDIDEACRNLD